MSTSVTNRPLETLAPGGRRGAGRWTSLWCRLQELPARDCRLDTSDHRQCDVAVCANEDWLVGLVGNLRGLYTTIHNLVIRTEDIARFRLRR